MGKTEKKAATASDRLGGELFYLSPSVSHLVSISVSPGVSLCWGVQLGVAVSEAETVWRRGRREWELILNTMNAIA